MSDPTKDQLDEKFRAYIDTEDHLYNCASYGEGQICCLGPDHVQYPQLKALIATEVAEAYKRGYTQRGIEELTNKEIKS